MACWKQFRNLTVSVVGGAGHVGLPFSIVVANRGAKMVYGIDLDSAKCHRLNGGEMIYNEEGGTEALNEALQRGNLEFTCDANNAYLQNSDVIAIMIGTPVDGEGNPRLDHLFDYVENTLQHALADRIERMLPTTIFLRSTVNPGTTRLVWNKLCDLLEMESRELINFVNLAFAPERVAQGVSIIETPRLPQIIGIPHVLNDWKIPEHIRMSLKESIDEFFLNIINVDVEILYMDWIEAELGKLITNMYRYVNFALANEFYMIGDQFSDSNCQVNVNKIINSVNKDYPRMNLPLPGPNVGGPCLFKDGKFLTADVPYGDLINTAFLVNEGFPRYVFNQVKKILKENNLPLKKILILGATFKKNSDDTRNSLSFKFAKICKQNGVEPIFSDPEWKEKDSRNTKKFLEHLGDDHVSAIVVMTPHDVFKDWLTSLDNLTDVLEQVPSQYRTGKILVSDVWKMTNKSQKSPSGFYFATTEYP